MLLLHMQEIVFVDSQEGLLSSRGGGGPRHTGTRLTRVTCNAGKVMALVLSLGVLHIALVIDMIPLHSLMAVSFEPC